MNYYSDCPFCKISLNISIFLNNSWTNVACVSCPLKFSQYIKNKNLVHIHFETKEFFVFYDFNLNVLTVHADINKDKDDEIFKLTISQESFYKLFDLQLINNISINHIIQKLLNNNIFT